jgi:hypothetical protein
MAAAPAGTWRIIANCVEGTLELGFDGCQLKGEVFSIPIFGFWDDQANKLTFVRAISGAAPDTIQVYTGYLMTGDPKGEQPCRWMAGYFEAFAQGDPTPAGIDCRRTVFGWFAEKV